MFTLLNRKPVLCFLFLFNTAVAAAAAVGGSHLHLHGHTGQLPARCKASVPMTMKSAWTDAAGKTTLTFGQ